MSDHFGAMTLPVTPGGLDPALTLLLDFAKAVLISEASDAFRAEDTTEPNSVVAVTEPWDPRRGITVEQKFPGLFAWGMKGNFEDVGVGFVRSQGDIVIAWIFPPARPERRALQDKVARPLAKILATALSDGRHPSWVHAADRAVVDAIRRTAAAPIVDTVYEGTDLDGVVGAGAFPIPRRVLFTFGAGTWDTTRAVVVEGALEDGTEWSDSVTPMQVGGVESIETAWIFSRVDRVRVPGQAGGGGPLSVGTADSSGVEHGSLIAEHVGASTLRCVGWQREVLQLPIKDGPPQPLQAIIFQISIQEMRDRTPNAMGYPTLDSAAGGLSNFSQIVSLGGLTVETENE